MPAALSARCCARSSNRAVTTPARTARLPAQSQAARPRRRRTWQPVQSLFGWGRQPATVAPPAEWENMALADLEELVVQSGTPIMVDFYTEWCGPCKILTKNMAILEPHMRERVTFHKIDAEKNDELASHFQIGKLPTLLVFKGSTQPAARYEGLMSAQDLELWLRGHLR